MLNYFGRAQLSSDHRVSDNWEQFEGRAKHDGDNSRRRDILWEGAALANHANLAYCLGYPKSFGPVTTLPCTAQCNIEISQGGIASAPTSQRAFAFAALTANIPAAGGTEILSIFPNATLPTAQCLVLFNKCVST